MEAACNSVTVQVKTQIVAHNFVFVYFVFHSIIPSNRQQTKLIRLGSEKNSKLRNFNRVLIH